MQEGTPIIIKKVKKGGHGHHGGAWKVAYADFVTAMMAFFMVMWILGMSEDEKASVAAYFKDPTGFTKKNPRYPLSLGMSDSPPKVGTTESGGDSLTAQEKKMVSEQTEMKEVQDEIEEQIQQDPALKHYVDAGDVEVNQTPNGLVIELIENETSGEVFFEKSSSIVRPNAQKVFLTIAPILAKSERPIVLTGHTDATPFPGSGYDNLDLSGDRANAVRRLLEANGVDQAKILSVEAKGAKELRMPDDPYHFSNRRVTILLPYLYQKGDVMRLPTEIMDEKTEGAFSLPNPGVGKVLNRDLKSESEAKAAEDRSGH